MSREDQEAREDRELAPYAVRARDSRGRAVPEDEPDRRTAFQRDRDRIVHTTAFRRLQYKTQVFVNDPGGAVDRPIDSEVDQGCSTSDRGSEPSRAASGSPGGLCLPGTERSRSFPSISVGQGDHFRTRLTHTIEVAQIARTIARTLRLNEDLVEAGALAHDLGHAPFGHSGGDALDECLRGHGGFEHNRQSLRIVDLLERRAKLGPSTPRRTGEKGRRGLNLTFEVRESIAKHERLDPTRAPFLEAQLVDTADALAYCAHDIDDGRRSGLVRDEDLGALPIWRRTETTARLIDLLANDLVDATAARLDAEGIDSVAAARARKGYLVDFSSEVRAQKDELTRFLHERLYRHPRVLRIRDRARVMLRELYEAYAADPGILPAEWRAWAEEAGRERAVCDYIAGMTDRYARQEWERLGS